MTCPQTIDPHLPKTQQPNALLTRSDGDRHFPIWFRWESWTGTIAIMLSVLAGPWVLPDLDGTANEFRGVLVQGLMTVRIASLLIVLLSFLSYLFQADRSESLTDSDSFKASSYDRWTLLGILSLSALLALPRLGTSLWWDELGTLTRVVNRGPLVIMTFSCQANNHLLNSCLCWIARAFPWDIEVNVHLLPFCFLIATITTVYWTLRPLATFRAALLAAFAVATHPTLVTHGVEARGYSGAIFFSALAVAISSGRFRRHWLNQSTAYVIANVAGIGFILTTVLVPFSHGILAIWRCVSSTSRKPVASALLSRPWSLMLASLWTGGLALLMYGLLLPQIAKYSSTAATHDHLMLGRALLMQTTLYLTGMHSLFPAIGLLMLSAFGWKAAFCHPRLGGLREYAVASLVPLIAVAIYLFCPGTSSSARFFCFLIVPTCCGIGIGLDRLLRHSSGTRLLAGLICLLWGSQLTGEHFRLLTINRPNLKQLAAELQGADIVMMGPQSDSNRFYFPDARVYRNVDDAEALLMASDRPPIIIEGRASVENHLTTPDPVLQRIGYRIDQTLPSAVPNEVEFIVYRWSLDNEVMPNEHASF